MDNYHLAKKDGEWRLRKENAERATKTFENKESAMNYSKEFMNNHGGSLKIHKGNGVFQEERTYPRNSDPKKSKG